MSDESESRPGAGAHVLLIPGAALLAFVPFAFHAEQRVLALLLLGSAALLITAALSVIPSRRATWFLVVWLGLALFGASAYAAFYPRVRLLLREGRSLVARGQLGQALAKLTEYREHQPPRKQATRASYSIAKALLGLGRYGEARQEFQALTRGSGNTAAKARYKLGLLALFEGRRADAARILADVWREKEATLAPEAGALARWLGSPDAQPAERVPDLDKRVPSFHEAGSWGRRYVVQGRYQEALPLLNHVLYKDLRAPRYLGKAHLALGELHAADEVWTHVVRAQRNKREVHACRYKLALLALVRDRREEAAKRFEELSEQADGAMVPEARAWLRWLKSNPD